MADRAVVTREHRLMALACLCVPRVLEELGPKTRAWVDFGQEHSRHDPAATLTAQAIADAEARGRATSSAEVTRLQGELAELKSQTNEYGRHPFPAASALADWELVKDEPVVIGRLAVIKMASGLPVCIRCHEYLPKRGGLCPKCIQRGPVACACQPGGGDPAGHMPGCREANALAPTVASVELEADLRKLRWGAMNPESSFWDPDVAAAYDRIAAALGVKL